MGSISINKAVADLKKHWNYSSLRPKQEEVITALSNENKVLALLPTGGGKSLCYQLPALQLDGITLVISPLIALMEDQVNALKKRGIVAKAIHSGLRNNDIDRLLSNVIYDQTKLLYVSPERLRSDSFLKRLSQYQISMLAVDEAHCISQWGHDFRPAYQMLKEFIDVNRPNRIIALTGTANENTIAEICAQLTIPQTAIVQDSFLRDNIKLTVSRSKDKMNNILKQVRKASAKTITYTRSRRNVEMIATFLKSHGISAAHYHAGLSFSDKTAIQNQFLKGEIQVVASTNAFGMGIDIPDIAQIIHYDIPPSLEEYYQEIGRAGRNGAMSSAILLYDDSDLRYHQSRVTSEFPSFDSLYSTYSKVHRYFDNLINEGEGMRRSLKLVPLAKSVGIGSRVLLNQLQALSKLNCLTIDDNPRDIHSIKYAVSPRVLREANLDKSLNSLLEFLMRHYADHADEWNKINVDHIADRLKKIPDVIVTSLNQLKSKRLINYHCLDQGLVITFNEGRLNRKDFSYKANRYTKLKQIKEDRMKAMLGYINCEACLNEYLLKYFNEDHPDKCSLCNHCLSANLMTISKRDIERMTRDELVQTLVQAVEEKNHALLKQLQSMASEGIISLDIKSALADETL